MTGLIVQNELVRPEIGCVRMGDKTWQNQNWKCCCRRRCRQGRLVALIKNGRVRLKWSLAWLAKEAAID
jgi:hypothetical protein